MQENGHDQTPVLLSSKDLFNGHKRILHTPAHSIASDLVVEVSEAGSPPPTLSPPDGDSHSTMEMWMGTFLEAVRTCRCMCTGRTISNARCLEGDQCGKEVLTLEETFLEARSVGRIWTYFSDFIR